MILDRNLTSLLTLLAMTHVYIEAECKKNNLGIISNNTKALTLENLINAGRE